MTRATILGGLVAAIALGFIVTVVTGERSVVSLEVWAGSTLVWFGLVLAVRCAGSIPTASGSWRPIWRKDRTEVRLLKRPTSLAATDQVVAGSLRQGRLFDSRLRPRLLALLADGTLDPDRLGAAAWITDERTTGRAPTLDELTEVLDLLENQP